METREENAVRERAGHARNGGNAHRQARETEHGRERHRAERGGADHLHDAAEQEAHDDGGLFRRGGDGHADVLHRSIYHRVSRKRDQPCGGSKEQRTDDRVKPVGEIFFDQRGQKADGIAREKARQDAVAADGHAADNGKNGVCAHGDGDEDGGRHTCHAAGDAADLTEEGDAGEIAADIVQNSLYEKSRNSGIGKARHGDRALGGLQTEEGKTGERQK